MQDPLLMNCWKKENIFPIHQRNTQKPKVYKVKGKT